MRLGTWQSSQEWRARLATISEELDSGRHALDVRRQNKARAGRDTRSESS